MVVQTYCIKQSSGFTVGKIYKCVGKSGSYYDIIDDSGFKQIMPSNYFKDVEKKIK